LAQFGSVYRYDSLVVARWGDSDPLDGGLWVLWIAGVAAAIQGVDICTIFGDEVFGDGFALGIGSGDGTDDLVAVDPYVFVGGVVFVDEVFEGTVSEGD
jgi:hypothetical protein